jgi:serine/threonine protein kinase
VKNLIRITGTKQSEYKIHRKLSQIEYATAPSLKSLETAYDSGEGITKNLFKIHFVIGKGGFGKVWKVELKKNRQLYAMKEMGKAKILTKKSVHSVMNERILLSSLNHSFLANIHYAFQDKSNLYLVMDLLTGGDLRYHLGKVRHFTESQTSIQPI